MTYLSKPTLFLLQKCASEFESDICYHHAHSVVLVVKYMLRTLLLSPLWSNKQQVLPAYKAGYYHLHLTDFSSVYLHKMLLVRSSLVFLFYCHCLLSSPLHSEMDTLILPT